MCGPGWPGPRGLLAFQEARLTMDPCTLILAELAYLTAGIAIL
jgi:hypothetical protein